MVYADFLGGVQNSITFVHCRCTAPFEVLWKIVGT
jgi:hypothetical protein